MTDLNDIWIKLEHDAPDASGVAYRRVNEGGPCGIRLQLGRPQGTWGFGIEVSSASIPVGFHIGDTKGFSSSVTTTMDAGHRVSIIALSAASSTYNDVFSRLANDVIGSVMKCADERSAVETLSGRLRIWERFFKQYSPTGMSVERQRGLFAELLVLVDDVLPRMDDHGAVATWLGPLGRPHDFICPSVSLEVKSSLGPVGGSVEISSARQLDEENAGRALVLVVVHLEAASTGGESLSSLVSRAAARIEGSPLATGVFWDTMRAAGWESADEAQYAAKSYTVRRVSYFHVRDGFPRLVETDLPAGVLDVRYFLSLSACELYRVGPTVVHSMFAV